MALQHLRVPWSSPPSGNARVASWLNGRRVRVWMPGGDPRFMVPASTAVQRVGRYGQELRNGTSFVSNLAISPEPDAVYECWLVVLGSTVPTGVSNSLLLADTAITGNGLGVVSTTVRVRASSSYVLTTNLVPQPYEPIFVVLRQGDYRVYQRGAKFTSASGNVVAPSRLGLGLSGMSLALAVRFTNSTPADDEIRALVSNPWQVFERRVFVSGPLGPALPALSQPTFVPGSLTAFGFRPRVTAS